MRLPTLLLALALAACGDSSDPALSGDASLDTDTVGDGPITGDDAASPREDALSEPSLPDGHATDLPTAPDATCGEDLGAGADAGDTPPDTETPDGPTQPADPTPPGGGGPTHIDPDPPTGGQGGGVCELNGFPAVLASYNDFGDLVILEAYDNDLPPFGVLGIEIYDGIMQGPGEREILEQNYRDCKLCVRIRTGCRMGGCDAFWLARRGRLVITSWDTHFAGYIEGVELVEVTIDDETFHSEEVEGGRGWCINRFMFNIAAD